MNQRNQKVTGAIFDMDGVLCDSEPFITEAAIRMFAERHRTEVQADDFDPFRGTGENRFLGGVAEKYGITLDMPSDKDLTYQLYLELIPGRLPPLPGAQAFIQQCRDAGIRTAVASSADRIKVDANLNQIGLPEVGFDAVICGSDVEHKKPAPDIFLAAAARLGLDPAACVVFEDAISGVQAAKAAGSVCVGITTSFDEDTLRNAGADFIAPDLAGVPDEAMGW